MATSTASLSELRKRLNRTRSEPREPSRRGTPPYCPETLARRAAGRWLDDVEAPLLAIDETLPLDTRHGPAPLADWAALDADTLRLIGGPAADCRAPAAKSLFLDTETTGLSGGAGTYAFLVGVAFFDRQKFHLRQYLLPGPGSECALLRRLLALIEQLGVRRLVTFNGRCYDIPLLDNRCVVHRLDRPWSRLAHVDLLYPARTLWQGHFKDCSLQTLERRVLRVGRGTDVPSALIPGSYFNFLRSGEFPLLPLILRHNRWDLLTLASLAYVMARGLQEPGREPTVEPSRAAALLTRRNRFAEAAALLEATGAADSAGDECLELARLRKRLGHHNRALGLFRTALAGPHPPRSAFEEAAKLLEHSVRDLPAALKVVIRALDRFPGCPELEARLHRLQCRIAGKRWY